MCACVCECARETAKGCVLCKGMWVHLRVCASEKVCRCVECACNCVHKDACMLSCTGSVGTLYLPAHPVCSKLAFLPAILSIPLPNISPTPLSLDRFPSSMQSFIYHFQPAVPSLLSADVSTRDVDVISTKCAVARDQAAR